MTSELLDRLKKECPHSEFIQTGELYIKASCLFHGEKNKQSLVFSIHKETFYCFSCHRRGEVDEYIRKYNIVNNSNSDFIEEWKPVLSIIKKQLERSKTDNNQKVTDQLLKLFREINNLKHIYATQKDSNELSK